MAGRKPDLVAVGAVTRRRWADDLPLGTACRRWCRSPDQRIGRTSDTHRLIDVGTPGERIADRTAKTGRRTAERFDLGRVVVGLVLKHEQPILLLAVHIHLDLD